MPHLVHLHDGIPDIVQGDPAVLINVQQVKRLLGLGWGQEVLQVLWQDVAPAVSCCSVRMGRRLHMQAAVNSQDGICRGRRCTAAFQTV